MSSMTSSFVFLSFQTEVPMRLLQVCNVGNICGGTAACAWTISRAFPNWEHTVLFLSRITPETRRVFAHAKLIEGTAISNDLVRTTGADLVILHNTHPSKCQPITSAFVVQYAHSVVKHAASDFTVACSEWLKTAMHDKSVKVLYQPVPLPPMGQLNGDRRFSDELVLGRICTPTKRKWPPSLIPFYSQLAERFPQVQFEFVGAPIDMQSELQNAVHQRARFKTASWNARSCYHRWHGLLYHHPSLTESFGRTASEAMRVGCVPIVDDRGGFREQIHTGVDGFLCQSTENFASAIDQLDAPGQWRELSGNAIESATQRNSLSRFAIEFKRILRHAANGIMA